MIGTLSLTEILQMNQSLRNMLSVVETLQIQNGQLNDICPQKAAITPLLTSLSNEIEAAEAYARDLKKAAQAPAAPNTSSAAGISAKLVPISGAVETPAVTSGVVPA